MASSVNRRIEGHLSRVMGQRDPAGLIRPRSTEPIRACGFAPRLQAVHMTAIGLRCRHVKKSLPAGGHPHMTRALSPRTLIRGHPVFELDQHKMWVPGSPPGRPARAGPPRGRTRGSVLTQLVSGTVSFGSYVGNVRMFSCDEFAFVRQPLYSFPQGLERDI